MPSLKEYDPSREIQRVQGGKVFISVGDKSIDHFPFLARIDGPTTGNQEPETVWYLIPRSVAEKYLVKAIQADPGPENNQPGDPSTKKKGNELQSPFTRTILYRIVEMSASEDYLGDKEGNQEGTNQPAT